MINAKPVMYIVTHKKCDFPTPEGYVPIQAGAAINQPVYDLTDATGDNISELNPHYCELTAQYWVWKNTKSDAVGFVHYRRYFYDKKYSNSDANILSLAQIESLLKNFDCILPEPLELRRTVWEEFAKYHDEKDLALAKRVACPEGSDYARSFDHIMRSRSFAPWNMFVMKWDAFDAYMSWLFPALERVQKQTDMSGYDSYNKRLLGFISERLLNVWVDSNKLAVCRRPVYMPGDNSAKSQIKNNLKHLLNAIHVR